MNNLWIPVPYFGLYSKMELLDHMPILFLIFWETITAFSVLVAPFYIPTTSAHEFQFLHILFNACYFLLHFFFRVAILMGVRWHCFIFVFFINLLNFHPLKRFTKDLLSPYNLFDSEFVHLAVSICAVRQIRTVLLACGRITHSHPLDGRCERALAFVMILSVPSPQIVQDRWYHPFVFTNM